MIRLWSYCFHSITRLLFTYRYETASTIRMEQGGFMVNNESYQVAIDILRCHLGMSMDEARKELGLDQTGNSAPTTETPEILIGLNSSN